MYVSFSLNTNKLNVPKGTDGQAVFFKIVVNRLTGSISRHRAEQSLKEKKQKRYINENTSQKKLA